jgi:hypothetical protein
MITYSTELKIITYNLQLKRCTYTLFGACLTHTSSHEHDIGPELFTGVADQTQLSQERLLHIMLWLRCV